MKNKSFITTYLHFIFSAILLVLSISIFSQNIPTHQVLSPNELASFLKKDVQKELAKDGVITQKALAKYFREKFSERYFYNWENFEKRFEAYNDIYAGKEKSHTSNALDHMAKYPDSTQWVLPFNYQNGKPVNAYAHRHLSRQHKMVDIAFHYFYQNQNTKYLSYFVRQVQSLNVALEKGAYEKIKDGNGVYEAFRSGYRALNWLQIHNMFLGQAAYSDAQQLTTIATLLQTGSHLYNRNPKFRSGNHQTRGLSALAMLSILFRDFEGTDLWLERSMDLLKQHLAKEINEDGFQFERSVHYHMSDIGNYYYVYQLAKISNIKVEPYWEEKLKSLFTTLTKIAYPDKSAPVLQDDTDDPWAEKNNISGALTLGYLLFEDPKIGYFATNQVKAKMFWYLSDVQINLLKNIKKERPTFKSQSFPNTGYYVMREGWNADDEVMIISAGLDKKKPDHQHGDMLGIQAMANGKVILPNYQVRYSLKDFDFFKNSMVKNVALVDDELQGKKWTSNKGGTGFGKFKDLPNPKTIAWNTNKDFDFFSGSHDGFENIGVKYSRQVIYVRNDFWIVKDNFKSKNPHVYKQVWQGHYSDELAPQLIRSTFDNASGCDILQLKNVSAATTSGARGKEWTVVSSSKETNFEFVTIIFPYSGYNKRIDEENENASLKGWERNTSKWKTKGEQPISLSKDNASIFFGVTELQHGKISFSFPKKTDVYVLLEDGEMKIQLLGEESVEIIATGTQEGNLNKTVVLDKKILSPGDDFIIKK